MRKKQQAVKSSHNKKIKPWHQSVMQRTRKRKPAPYQMHDTYFKMAKAESENSKVGIRNLRKEAIDNIKKLKTDGLSEDDAKTAEEDVQKWVDSYIKKTEETLVQKEKEILTV